MSQKLLFDIQLSVSLHIFINYIYNLIYLIGHETDNIAQLSVTVLVPDLGNAGKLNCVNVPRKMSFALVNVNCCLLLAVKGVKTKFLSSESCKH